MTTTDPRPEASPITGLVVVRLMSAGCLSKRPWPSSTAARGAAADYAVAYPPPHRHPVRAYWCPWAAHLDLRPHWHIGHLPSVERLQLIADAIRWCAEHGCPDGVDTRAIRRARARAGRR